MDGCLCYVKGTVILVSGCLHVKKVLGAAENRGEVRGTLHVLSIHYKSCSEKSERSGIAVTGRIAAKW